MPEKKPTNVGLKGKSDVKASTQKIIKNKYADLVGHESRPKQEIFREIRCGRCLLHTPQQEWEGYGVTRNSYGVRVSRLWCQSVKELVQVE
jgi:hypothetical protein